MDNNFEQEKVAYINMLQSTIARMNTNSLYCKVLCGTLITALATVSSVSGFKFILISLVPTCICAYADTCYLSLEKIYRDKFDATVESYYSDCKNSASIKIFDMQPGNSYMSCENLTRAFQSWSIKHVYIGILIYSVILAIVKSA